MKSFRLLRVVTAVVVTLGLGMGASAQEKAVPGGGAGWEALRADWEHRAMDVRSDRPALEKLVAQARQTGDDLVVWCALVAVMRQGGGLPAEERVRCGEEAAQIAKRNDWPKEYAYAISNTAGRLPQDERIARGPGIVDECTAVGELGSAARACIPIAQAHAGAGAKAEAARWFDRGFELAAQGEDGSAFDRVLWDWQNTSHLTRYEGVLKARELYATWSDLPCLREWRNGWAFFGLCNIVGSRLDYVPDSVESSDGPRRSVA
jgi:hypothetical protein